MGFVYCIWHGSNCWAAGMLALMLMAVAANDIDEGRRNTTKGDLNNSCTSEGGSGSLGKGWDAEQQPPT